MLYYISLLSTHILSKSIQVHQLESTNHFHRQTLFVFFDGVIKKINAAIAMAIKIYNINLVFILAIKKLNFRFVYKLIIRVT